MNKKIIADITASFENRKHNLAFDIQDGTGYIYLVADGLQMADVAKLLLLKGKGKIFGVRFYEKNSKKIQKRASQRIIR